MNKQNKEISTSNKHYKSTAGYFFEKTDPVWILDKDVSVIIESVTELFDDAENYRNVMAYYAETYSSKHVRNINTRFLDLLRSTQLSKITETMLINYKSNLTKKTEWYLGTLRGFFRKWFELGYPGISQEVIDLLDGWRIKGNKKGENVKKLDPQSGPFTDMELQAINDGALSAFEKNEISITELALCLLLSHTGRRPIQLSHLKIKDVLQGKNIEGEKAFLLNIPRAKQRGTTFREEFKQFAITRELYTKLNAQVQIVREQIYQYLPFEIENLDFIELPLFLNKSKVISILSLKELRSLQNIDKLHITTESIYRTLSKIVEIAQIHSERTGELIHINSTRFRYTTGTRAAREGFGDLVIAELLDHSDTQNSGVYIKNIPDHVEALDKAVGKQLAPFAQAFAGVLIDSEDDAKRANDLNSRIKSNGEGIGSCGSHGFCGANVPIPCYTCINFQPWLDGPHERVLNDLIEERKRVFEITNDMQIASINDRTILAVQDVINRCEIRREELNNE